jgi:hypothetical protein
MRMSAITRGTGTMDRTTVIIMGVVLVVGGALGWLLKGCAVPKPPETVITESVTRHMRDSIAAVVYAEIVDTLQAMPIERVLWRTHNRIVADTVAMRRADEWYALLVECADREDRAARDNEQMRDFTATAATETDAYRLSQAFSMRSRQFGHVLDIYRRDTVRIVEGPPAPRSFWDRFGYGVQLGVGMIGYAREDEWRAGVGGYVGIGLHYDFSKH